VKTVVGIDSLKKMLTDLSEFMVTVLVVEVEESSSVPLQRSTCQPEVGVAVRVKVLPSAYLPLAFGARLTDIVPPVTLMEDEVTCRPFIESVYCGLGGGVGAGVGSGAGLGVGVGTGLGAKIDIPPLKSWMTSFAVFMATAKFMPSTGIP